MNTLCASHASKVEALAAQYRSGSYRADSAATSRGMISAALTLGDD
jgi:hypothetical protein